MNLDYSHIIILRFHYYHPKTSLSGERKTVML